MVQHGHIILQNPPCATVTLLCNVQEQKEKENREEGRGGGKDLPIRKNPPNVSRCRQTMQDFDQPSKTAIAVARVMAERAAAACLYAEPVYGTGTLGLAGIETLPAEAEVMLGVGARPLRGLAKVEGTMEDVIEGVRDDEVTFPTT